MIEPKDLLLNFERAQIEKHCRQSAQAVYVGDGRLLARALGKYKLFCDATDTAVTPHLALDGFYEIWLCKLIAGFVKPGMRCVCFESTYGYYSLLLADLAGSEMWSRYKPPHLFTLDATWIRLWRETAACAGVEFNSGSQEDPISFLKIDMGAHRDAAGALVQSWECVRDRLAVGSVAMVKFDPRWWSKPEQAQQQLASMTATMSLSLVDGDGKIQPTTRDHVLEEKCTTLWLTRAT